MKCQDETRETYAGGEVRRQLERGPHPDEDFFRVKITGNGATKTLNVSREQLEKIRAVLDA